MHQTLIALSLVLTFGQSAMALPELSRLRELYKKGCQAELNPPPGSRTATGVMMADDASAEEFELGLRLLRRRTQRTPAGDYPFASFLYKLTAERSDGLIEDLFFDYINRPGNENLRRNYAGEMMEIAATNVLLHDAKDEVTEQRLNQMIAVIREDPAKNGPLWDNVITGFLCGQVINAKRLLDELEKFRVIRSYESEAIEMVSEVLRPVERTVADLRVGGYTPVLEDVRALITGLRMDEWVREQAGLRDAPAVIEVKQQIGFLGQALTRH